MRRLPQKISAEKRNVKLDAAMIHAAMRGMIVPFGISVGMNPSELYRRSEWLKKQPKSYVDKVVKQVESYG